MTWLFFTGYCWLRGYSSAAAICLFEVVAIVTIIEVHRGHANYRRVMNLTLGTCASGLLFVSISHPALHQTMLFYPVSILIASQLLGVRAAFQWLVVSSIANTFFFLIIHGDHGSLDQWHMDEMTLVYGVGVCVFFCCQQGEEFYRERTKGLVDLSHHLRQKGKRLHKLATTDSLTGLLNRFQFQVELQQRVKHASVQNERMALLLIDMDGFKEINDTLGHPVGDEALCEIAKRLQHKFDDRATVARLGGDEFCLIFPDVGTVEQAESIARQTGQILAQRCVLDEFDFPMGASIGIALCPDHTQYDTDLLAYADTAMFFAKERQFGHALYAPDMTTRLIEYRTMQEHLSMALERNEFFLVYQPQANFSTGRVVGVEALLRWQHGEEVISPVRFIPLLEKSREIVRVGRWIIRESCRQLRAWIDAGYDVEVSINLSSIQFNDDDLIEHVAESICAFGLDASKLDFEITESLLVDDVNQAAARLSQLKELGARISIDDFGTGYSSLAYLRQLPIDRLKIDRAFVKDIPDTDDGVIAKSIIVLSKALGMRVLAEGVETQSQFDFLKSQGCDQYQGYFLSPPAPPDALTGILEKSQPTPSSPSNVSPPSVPSV